MNPLIRRLPLFVILLAVTALLLHGPIPQFARYHDFADQRSLFGLPHAADVLSNFGFVMLGAWGLAKLWPQRSTLGSGWQGYSLFLISLMLTATGSAFYHLAPNDLRLVWDRLPIALACVGLLHAVHSETARNGRNNTSIALPALAAVLSVMWWNISGDLRPYLLLQVLPLVLIPLWQWIYGAPSSDRLSFGIAICLYILAKVAELHDYEVLATFEWLSGHTAKHLLATAAATVIVTSLAERVKGYSPHCT